jgi:hypothetical protein
LFWLLSNSRLRGITRALTNNDLSLFDDFVASSAMIDRFLTSVFPSLVALAT